MRSARSTECLGNFGGTDLAAAVAPARDGAVLFLATIFFEVPLVAGTIEVRLRAVVEVLNALDAVFGAEPELLVVSPGLP
jgi:hypothetical protein